MTWRTLLVVAAAAAAWGGCADRPAPRAAPPASAAARPAVAPAAPADAPVPSALASTPAPVSITLGGVRAAPLGADTLLVTADVTLRNDTGAPLATRTNFGSAFDGLSLVLVTAGGREVRRQGYVFHQSPYAENRVVVLPVGVTRRELGFPLAPPPDPRGLRAYLVGDLRGTTHAGLRSNEVAVEPAAPRGP